MIVTHYGLHWAPGDIGFLHQQGVAQNLVSPALYSPFDVKTRPRTMICPHNIDLNTHTPVPDWVQDPLADIMLPKPYVAGEKVKIILDPDRKLEGLIRDLCRLCSAPWISLPIWAREPYSLSALYKVTNLTPMVLMSVEPAHGRAAISHLHLAQVHSRRCLIVARGDLPLFDNVEWIKTELGDVSSEPLEAIGAGVLRKVMSDGPAKQDPASGPH